MDNIRRQITRDILILLLISDPPVRGITIASRMQDQTAGLCYPTILDYGVGTDTPERCQTPCHTYRTAPLHGRVTARGS